MPFWKDKPNEGVEELLRANRPEPDREFVEATVARVRASTPRRSLGLGRFSGRFAAAVAISALALIGATAAAGGVGKASNGVKSFVVSGVQTFGLDHHSGNNGNGNGNENGNGNDGNGNGNNGNEQGEQGGQGDDGNDQGQDNDGGDDNDQGSGDHQYKVRLCHFTHDAKMPYVLLLLSPQGALEHLLHHPLDYLPLDDQPCIEQLP